MKQDLMRAAALGLVGIALASCGGGSHKATTVVTPTPPAAKFEDQFGSAATFGAAFGASPNSEPRDVNAGDVIPVNPTAEPVTIPGT